MNGTGLDLMNGTGLDLMNGNGLDLKNGTVLDFFFFLTFSMHFSPMNDVNNLE